MQNVIKYFLSGERKNRGDSAEIASGMPVKSSKDYASEPCFKTVKAR
jgi:hypothetical protein